MTIQKNFNHIKNVINLINNNDIKSPSSAMRIVQYYSLSACQQYYGILLKSALLQSFYDKDTKSDVIMTKDSAKNLLPQSRLKHLKHYFKHTDYIVVTYLIEHNQILSIRKMTYQDVINCIKRIFKRKYDIDAKDAYDPKNKLGIERDFNKTGLDISEIDLDLVSKALEYIPKPYPKPLEKFEEHVYIASNYSISPDYVKFTIHNIPYMIRLLQITKSQMLSKLPVEDKKNYYRLYNKLVAYEHFLNHRTHQLMRNSLIQKITINMCFGNIRQALSLALKKHNHKNFLSNVTHSIMLLGVGTQIFIDVDQWINNYRTSVSNSKTDRIKAKDFRILKQFQSHGYHYANIHINNHEIISKIRPIHYLEGIKILHNLLKYLTYYHGSNISELNLK